MPKNATDAAEDLLKLRETICVVLGPDRELLGRFGRIIVNCYRFALRRDCRHADARLGHAQPVLFEGHVAHNFCPNRAACVRERGAPKSRTKLLCNSHAADHWTCFQYYRLQSGAREIKRGDKPIMPTADDDHVTIRAHKSGFPIF
jgi:hypothetical protein